MLFALVVLLVYLYAYRPFSTSLNVHRVDMSAVELGIYSLSFDRRSLWTLVIELLDLPYA